MFTDASSYVLDAWQRSVLFLDVMRQRAIQYREHAAKSTPHVLDFEAQLVCDGRTLERPVNYGLVRIVTPQGIVIDDRTRSSSSIRGPGTVPASTASRLTARSASR